MADRDLIFSEFQIFTGLDDYGQCLTYLEESDWDLQLAVQNALFQMENLSPVRIDPSAEDITDVIVNNESPSPTFPVISSTTTSNGKENNAIANNKTSATMNNISNSVNRITVNPFEIGFKIPYEESSVDPDNMFPLISHFHFATNTANERANNHWESYLMEDDTNELPSTSAGTSYGGSSSFLNNTKVKKEKFSVVSFLNFTVEYRNTEVNLVIPDNERVVKIKELMEEKTGIPISKQELHGWIHKNDALVKDTDFLSDLQLPKNNTLFLLCPDLPVEHPIISIVEDNLSNSVMFELHVHFLDDDGLYKIKFPASKTILDVKIDIAMLTNVDVRFQAWTGWPANKMITDKMTLLEAGIKLVQKLEMRSTQSSESSGQNKLKVSRSSPTASSLKFENKNHFIASGSNGGAAASNRLGGFNDGKQPSTSRIEGEVELESDTDEIPYDDIVDIDPTTPPITNNYAPLMPANSTDQVIASENFCREFANRYGETHPIFYIGRLEDALKDSLFCKARERKLLVIYLHHDNSILTNVFCSQILCSETIVSFLSNNFISWAWDLTHKTNAEILLGHCTTHFGSIAASQISHRMVSPDSLPLLLIISRSRGINEVVEIIEGSCTISEIMSRLLQATEMHRLQLTSEIADEDEREARGKVLAEQDAAYQESLALDRAKADSKRMEEEEENKRFAEERRKQERERVKIQKEEKDKKALQEILASDLPDEPEMDSVKPVITFKVRCPGGEMLTRRFYKGHYLSDLFNFISSEGFAVERFKLLTTYPRRDLLQLAECKTFEQLNLCAQETVTLEEI